MSQHSDSSLKYLCQGGPGRSSGSLPRTLVFPSLSGYSVLDPEVSAAAEALVNCPDTFSKKLTGGPSRARMRISEYNSRYRSSVPFHFLISH